MESSRNSAFFASLVRKLFGPKMNYRVRYYHQRGHWPNLENPKDLSEHIISEMFSPGFEKYARFADKYLVREYIKEKGLERILLKHYGVWDKPEEIDFEPLPEKFILKANNGSGPHVICKDKSSLIKDEAIKTLNVALELGEKMIEPHYRAIVPKVFCEELIDTGTDEWPTDYKFTCIEGEICDVFVATERRTSTKYCTLDLDWNVLPYTRKEYMPDVLPEKPRLLKEMAEIAKILSKDFKFVRVDLYEYHGQVFFSELTFTPWGGLMYSYTNEALELLGSKFSK